MWGILFRGAAVIPLPHFSDVVAVFKIPFDLSAIGNAVVAWQDWYKDGLIFLLAVLTAWGFTRILRLEKTVAKANREQFIPILMLDIASTRPGIFLHNEGQCFASDIRVEDIACVLDYDFKKTLTLKFGRVGYLKPGEKVKLDCRIFDGNYEMPYREAENLQVHLSRSAFEAKILCNNIEGIKYTLILTKLAQGFHIKQALPSSD